MCMQIRRLLLPLSSALLLSLTGCGSEAPKTAEPAAAPAAPPVIAAEMIASDPTWGNTEGPAVDSKGTLYFCSRGAFKGIVSWTQKDGAHPFVQLDKKFGPGGLWIDEADNIYATGVGDRLIWKVAPDKTITVLAKGFEAKPAVATGPNDLTMAPNRSIYFTDPNGFDGSAPVGTIYRLFPDGKVTVFNDTITGPNGISISQDGKTLFVAHNTAKTTARIERFPLRDDGSAGEMAELVTVPDCVADGMDIDRDGNVWLTCYSFGTAYLVNPGGKIVQTITTGQKAITNCFFGRGSDRGYLYLTSSDMERVTGYIYRAKPLAPGFR
jgi:gluconolactonase